MKFLQVISREGTHLYGAMIRKQAKIHRNGRGTFMHSRSRKCNSARWTHVRFKGSISFERVPPEAVKVAIQTRDRGDEARLLSSFVGWLDRHFGKQPSSIGIEYRRGVIDGENEIRDAADRGRRDEVTGAIAALKQQAHRLCVRWAIRC